MNKARKTSAILLFGVALFAPSWAAFATDTAQAIKLCDANPNCKHYQDGITIVLTVKNGKDVNQVECPSIDGECSVVLGPGGSRSSRITGLLRAGGLPTATMAAPVDATAAQ